MSNAISVENVKKDFKLPHLRRNSIKSIFTEAFSRKSKSIEVQHALRGVSFSIEKGDFFGIVGKNGSGKSTLLKMLAGIYQPTSGSIQVNGKLVPFIELGVGFNPELSGRQNVYLNGALLGFDRKQIEDMYEDIVQFAELDKFMDQKLKNYSSGMQVRLAFSMAIRADADILLIDEVLAVGDADFQRKCFDYFARLKQNKKTVVFVSHDMDAVKDYCNKAVLISKGKVVAYGEPSTVAEEYFKEFNTGGNDKDTQQKEKWGDGSLSHKDVKVQVGHEHVLVTVRAQLNSVEGITDPVMGFVIKNSAGQAILGSNSYLIGKKINFKNKKTVLEWRIPDIFGDGSYTVDVAAHHKAGTPVYEWWESAATFTIKKQRHSHYPVSPEYTLKILN